MIVVVDGNDGTGKSTLVVSLRKLGFQVQDRGAPSRMIDSPDAGWEEGEIYLILDAAVDVCQARLTKAGRNLNVRFRTQEDLELYRVHYGDVATEMPHCAVVDSSGSAAATLERALTALARLGVTG